MSVNSSFFSESYAHPNVSTIYSSLSFQMYCLRSKPSSIIYTTFSLIRMFLYLPLSTFILHLGLQQWKQKRSTSSAAPMSHSDFFTYLSAIIELINVLRFVLCNIGIYNDDSYIFFLGINVGSFVWYGEMHVNVLTCVERYLAVVHPITYLRHRNNKGITIRNIICICLFLSCFIGIGLVMLGGDDVLYDCCLLSLALIMVSFCSLSVLCILIRPGPGEQGKNKPRIDPSKQRAFFTIVAILVVLLLRFAYRVVWLVIYLDADYNNCIVIACGLLCNMPSSLVLPILFLYRTGKCVCCKVSGFV